VFEKIENLHKNVKVGLEIIQVKRAGVRYKNIGLCGGKKSQKSSYGVDTKSSNALRKRQTVRASSALY
jgi:hypothetical protein